VTGRPRGMAGSEGDAGEDEGAVGREEREGTVAAPNDAEELSDAPTEGDDHDVAEVEDLDVEVDERDDAPSPTPAEDASVPNAFDRLASGAQAGTAGRRASARVSADAASSRPRPATVPSLDGDARCASCARGSHRQPPPDDAVACTVCLEPCAISGPHQAASLACGHVFGHACISQWLERKKKKNGGRCPQCNVRAATKDIRKLFVPSFHAFVDTDELDDMRRVLAEQRAGRVDAETTATRVSRRLIKIEADLEKSRAKVEALEDELRMSRDALAKAERRILATDASHTKRKAHGVFGELDERVTDGVAPLFRKTVSKTTTEKNRNALRELLQPPDGENDETFGTASLQKRERSEAMKRRSVRLRNGRFVFRTSARVNRARAFDVDGVVAAVGERAEIGESAAAVAADFLTKISLRSPDSRVRVALPSGAGHVRDVRLSGGGTAAVGGMDAFGGRTLALAATLGKKLFVVDLDRDHVAARVDLPHAAWSCAWGGWGLGHLNAGETATTVSLPGGEFRVAPSKAAVSGSGDSRGDPSRDPNLCVVGGANGEVLMYDLRATKIALARVRPPTKWVRSDARPVHTVIPVARRSGGGVLYGTCAGVRAFVPRGATVDDFYVSGDDDARRQPDADETGVVVRVPGVETCGASLAFHRGAKTLVATTTARETATSGTVFAKHVVREWDGEKVEEKAVARQNEKNASGSGATASTASTASTSTSPFPWFVGPDATHARPRVTCRAALTGPRGASLPGLVACGAVREDGAFRKNVVSLTDAVSGVCCGDLEHFGLGHIEDVRGWCGDAPGSVEVLASLGPDAMTVFSWDSSSR
jgi:hypothetical protein